MQLLAFAIWFSGFKENLEGIDVMILVHDVPFDQVKNQSDEIFSWHSGVQKDFGMQFEKHVGNSNIRWFELFDDSRNLLAVAGVTEFYYSKGDLDNMVYMNQLWAKSGFGKQMVDNLFEYFKKNRVHKDIETFVWAAYESKVIDNYRKNYKEYLYMGNNKWGYPTFQRKF